MPGLVGEKTFKPMMKHNMKKLVVVKGEVHAKSALLPPLSPLSLVTGQGLRAALSLERLLNKVRIKNNLHHHHQQQQQQQRIKKIKNGNINNSSSGHVKRSSSLSLSFAGVGNLSNHVHKKNITGSTTSFLANSPTPTLHNSSSSSLLLLPTQEDADLQQQQQQQLLLRRKRRRDKKQRQKMQLEQQQQQRGVASRPPPPLLVSSSTKIDSGAALKNTIINNNHRQATIHHLLSTSTTSKPNSKITSTITNPGTKVLAEVEKRKFPPLTSNPFIINNKNMSKTTESVSSLSPSKRAKLTATTSTTSSSSDSVTTTATTVFTIAANTTNIKKKKKKCVATSTTTTISSSVIHPTPPPTTNSTSTTTAASTITATTASSSLKISNKDRGGVGAASTTPSPSPLLDIQQVKDNNNSNKDTISKKETHNEIVMKEEDVRMKKDAITTSPYTDTFIVATTSTSATTTEAMRAEAKRLKKMRRRKKLAKKMAQCGGGGGEGEASVGTATLKQPVSTVTSSPLSLSSASRLTATTAIPVTPLSISLSAAASSLLSSSSESLSSFTKDMVESLTTATASMALVKEEEMETMKKKKPSGTVNKKITIIAAKKENKPIPTNAPVLHDDVIVISSDEDGDQVKLPSVTISRFDKIDWFQETIADVEGTETSSSSTSSSRSLLLSRFKSFTSSHNVFINNAPVNTKLIHVIANGRGWLNDEIINTYLFILQEHRNSLQTSTSTTFSMSPAGRLQNNDYLEVRFMPTFFYSRLSGSYDSIFKFDYNYPIISKWTKRAPLNLGAFAYNTILIPINKSQSHWCMAVVHVMEKRIEFYDSMGGQGTSANIMKLVKKWMEDEWEQKVMKSYTIGRMGTSTNRLDTLLSVAYANENWECNHINSCPQQADGFSCGMFVCMIAKRLTLGKSREGLLLASSSSNKSNTRRNFALDFHQSDVYEFRRAVSLQLQLLTVKNED